MFSSIEPFGVQQNLKIKFKNNRMKILASTKFLQVTVQLVMLFTLMSVSFSCKKENSNPNNEYLVQSKWIATVTKSYILAIAEAYPDIYNALSTKDLSDVKIYKITYKTKNIDGIEIEASGAFLIPVTGTIFPLLSYQHGSLFTQTDAPSEYNTGLETRGLATILASAGYAVSVPDYIGYGASANYPHPYEHAKSLATTSYDMLMAVKEFAAQNGIVLNDKLFLTGYSEGGNATMALHKYIEENTDLVVTMCAPGSGAYNKTAFSKEIMQRNEDLNFLPRFMWVLDSYNWIYGLNRPWSQYVNEPYATTLEAVTNPFKFGEANISKNPQILFTTTTIDGVANGTDNQFMAALADNDDYDWKPKAPVTFYYGLADDYVFPLNTETAYNAMLAKGATVTKVGYPGLDHEKAATAYALDMFELFETLK